MRGGLLAQRSPRLLVIPAGLLAGAILVMDGVSIGALVYAGPLERWLPQGMQLCLIGMLVMAVLTGLRSSFAGTIATVQDATAILLSAIAGGVAARLGPDDPRTLPSVLASVSLATATTGLFLFLLGRVGLGRMVRFIPYPVVGGFLAGTGWLIAEAALNVIWPDASSFSSLLAHPALLLPWVPGVLFGLLLLGMTRRSGHPLLVPGALLGGIVVFYLYLLVSGTEMAEARAAGLLLDGGRLSLSSGVPPLLSFGHVAWAAVLPQGGRVGALILIAAISMLLNATALELEARTDLDMDQELRATGLGNLVAGLCGGVVGFHGITLSTLTHRMGARGRGTSLIAAGVVLLAILAGASLISLLPRAVIGGLLLYIGLSILVEWVWDARTKLPRVEVILVLGIGGVVAFWDFLPGVALGVICSLFVFVARYSRIDFIKYTLSRAQHQSQVERAPRMDLLLSQKGQEIRVLCLQGFLFFGTATALYDRVRALLRQSTPPRYILLDFRLTTGLDGSAALSFLRIRQLAQDADVKLIFTQIADRDARLLADGGCPVDDRRVSRRFPDLDHGLGWCEDRIIDEAMAGAPETVQLGSSRRAYADFADPKVVAQLSPWLESEWVDRGGVLGPGGDLSGALYLVAQGEVTLWTQGADGTRRRLVSVGPGNLVGGLEYMRQMPSGVVAIADTNSQILVLRASVLEEVKRTKPALILAFQDMLLEMMADRLAHAQRELATLLS